MSENNGSCEIKDKIQLTRGTLFSQMKTKGTLFFPSELSKLCSMAQQAMTSTQTIPASNKSSMCSKTTAHNKRNSSQIKLHQTQA